MSRIVFGIFTLGSLTAAIPASYLPDRFGRRFSMFCGNLFIIVGAIVTASSKDRSMFVGGRFLTGKISSLTRLSPTLISTT
jgi:MFS family permease